MVGNEALHAGLLSQSVLDFSEIRIFELPRHRTGFHLSAGKGRLVCRLDEFHGFSAFAAFHDAVGVALQSFDDVAIEVKVPEAVD